MSLQNINKTLTTAVASTMTTLATVSTVAVNVTRNNSTDISGCYKVDPNWDHMFRSYDDKEYPWIGLWFSLPVTGIWYWCTDQVTHSQF